MRVRIQVVVESDQGDLPVVKEVIYLYLGIGHPAITCTHKLTG